MSGSAAFDQVFPPCALACVVQYPTLEAACAAVSTIVTCAATSCTGPDLNRFENFLSEFVPLCGSAPISFGGAFGGANTAGTLDQPWTVVSATSVPTFRNINDGSASTVSGAQVRATNTISSAVPAGAGSSLADESNSTGLYVGVGVGIAVVVIAAIAFFVTRNRRKQAAALERLHQAPHEDLQDQHKGYDALNDTLSINATVASPAAQAAVNLHTHVDAIDTQHFNGKAPVPSSSSWNPQHKGYDTAIDVGKVPVAPSVGENRNTAWNAYKASAPSPAPVSKSSMMNAAYVPPTYRKSETDGAQQFIVADSTPYHVGNAQEVSQPPHLVTSDPSKWSVAEVEAWARALPHFGSKIGNIMLEYQINGRVLMGLTRDSMKDELGLVFGEVAQLEADIAVLRAVGVREDGLPPGYDDA
ncbi:hypothetical protein HDU81_010805 [Chytriomyces hyalinus]|nr:hypothetical protein HDU81_010805 [Chytriomyces hyalinus]